MATIDVVLLNASDHNMPDEHIFVEWLKPVAEHLQVDGEVCIKIVSSEESQLLNSTYRKKDKPTNVLSFPAELPEFVESPELGDLAICAEVVIAEAKQQGKTMQHHLAHLCVHGVLHLLGYDHEEKEQAREMENLEISILSQLAIANPYETTQL
ncbi:rRNA maturation RNase YbeY [Marinicella sp. W31]|uniref:rRNA maturation RNase YbeY n=1 Tax=Marinicella sp. W31 TaxID=3023713 RepID=UPI003757374C